MELTGDSIWKNNVSWNDWPTSWEKCELPQKDRAEASNSLFQNASAYSKRIELQSMQKTPEDNLKRSWSPSTYFSNSLTENLRQYQLEQLRLHDPVAKKTQHFNEELSDLMNSLALYDWSCNNVKYQKNVKPAQPTPTGCVFCKNNNYHSTFYRSHTLKDTFGNCQCPVLRAYVCPLCNASGDQAHTIKYCPMNGITKGNPVAAGLPPGKVTNWKEMARQLVRKF